MEGINVKKEDIVTELVSLYDALIESDFSTPKQDKALLEAIRILREK